MEIEPEFLSFEKRSYSVRISYFDYCFANCPKLSILPEHFIYINVTERVTNGVGNWCGNIRLVNTFEGCRNLNVLPKHLVYIDTVSIAEYHHLALYETFKNCGITSITQPLVYIKGAYPYQMTGTFVGCHDLVVISSPLVVGNVFPHTSSHWTSIWQDTFKGCQSLETVLSLDSANAYHNLFDGTFANCSSLKHATCLGNNSSYKDTYANSSVEFVDREFFIGGIAYIDVFTNCTKLISIKTGESSILLGQGGTSSAYFTYFRDTLYREETSYLSTHYPVGLFKNCTSLKDTGNLTLVNGNNVFEGCISLEKFTHIRSLYTYELSECFKGCTSLRQIDVELPVNKGGVAGNLTGLFEGCTSLEDIGGIASIPLQSQYEVKLDRTFKGCTSLAIEFPEWWEVITSENSYTSHVDTFDGCVNLANYNEIPDDWK